MSKQFNISDIEIFHTIGKGGYSRVKIARSRTNPIFFALKCMKKSALIKSKQVDHIHSEFILLSVLDNPFIIRFLGYSQDSKYFYLALEFIQGGDLFTYIRTKKTLPPSQTALYASQITLALKYLHDKSIVYRDLKPENLLIKPNGYLKLTDFGLSKVISNRTQTFCGTAEYMAPEIIKNEPYGKAVDWWSLGILIYEMLTGLDPFHDEDPMLIYSKILSGKIEFPKGFDRPGKSIIKRLLVHDLSKRFGNMKKGVRDIKNHMFFRDVEWELVEYQVAAMPYKPNVRCQADASNYFKYPDSLTEAEEVAEEDPFKGW